jgi:hypothetical protein
MVSDSTITSADVQDGSLTAADVQDGTLTGSDVQDGSIAAADVQDGSLTGTDIQDASIQGADLAAGATAIARDTAKASTSGVAVEFTGIPSWARRITVLFNGVSTNGATNILVQVGTGGAPTTSGYAGYSVFSWASGIVPVSSTAGIPVFNNAASYNHYGELVLTNISGNTWVASGQFATAGTQGSTISGGAVTLAGVLNYLRVVTANGTDAFDAGSINVLYE